MEPPPPRRPKSTGPNRGWGNVSRNVSSANSLVFSKETVEEAPKKAGSSALAKLLLETPPRSRSSSLGSQPVGLNPDSVLLLSEADASGDQPSGARSDRTSRDLSAKVPLVSSDKESGDPNSNANAVITSAVPAASDAGSALFAHPISTRVPFVCRVVVPSASASCIIVRITEDCSIVRLLHAILKHCILPPVDEKQQQLTDAAVGVVAQWIELCVADDDGNADDDYPQPHFDFSQYPVFPNELWIGPRESHRAFDPSLRLLRAAECGELEVLSQLLNHHAANVNATGIDNFTCLHFAARQGHLSVVNYVLKHFADLNIDAQTKNGWTPLHLACDRGHRDIAEVLLVCGADASIQTPDGLTALQRAQQKEHSDIVDLLTTEFGVTD